MKIQKLKTLWNGASADSFFLIAVRMVTLVFSLLMTRILSGHFSVHDYGTYSQIMLLVSTVSSITILGMVEAVNYFFCKETDVKKRDTYVSTIFSLQYMVSALAAVSVLALTVPISRYFDNNDIKSLIIFAALMPVLQNSISLLQILFVAIGKAKLIAIRNFLVSALKLCAITAACYVFNHIAALLLFLLLLEILQIVYFLLVLRKNKFVIHLKSFDRSLLKEILEYCVPMAMFTLLNSFNRDCDKYVISAFTDTETLAVYSNASKLLPFDVIMSSFCTVLLPYITRYIARKEYDKTQRIYKSFLELSYISTGVLAVSAVCAVPDLMRFLYSEKYLAGVQIFTVYILIDIIRFMNFTVVLNAAGKTKTIMYISAGSFAANIVLNIVFFHLFGVLGPALSSLLIMLANGIVIQIFSAKQIQAKITELLDYKRLLLFIVEAVTCVFLLTMLRNYLTNIGVHYILRLIFVYGLCACILLALNFKQLIRDVRLINQCKAQ